MRIAFYAPLKSPNHPVPSGDRQMARMLIKALDRCGHDMAIASEMRSFSSDPAPEVYAALATQAGEEIARLSGLWRQSGKPDLWFCYHPYYKAPDLIGPTLAADFGIPYVTAEASFAPRRATGAWAEAQARVTESLRNAALNICFTRRDREGLSGIVPEGRLAMLPPFIDTAAFSTVPQAPDRNRLITVAMMRKGDKLDSYRMLAEALGLLRDLPWTLSVVGDGPCRAEVVAAFSVLPTGRVEWLGGKDPNEVAPLLYEADVYVWPGFGEAYGVAYMEAQAAALPVVAQNVAGVPEVVLNGKTGLLTPPGNVSAYASAITRLLSDKDEQRQMGQAARSFVLEERSLDGAAARLDAMLKNVGAPV
jgi:glycosyltransferase involved in cell wall biosynthesis